MKRNSFALLLSSALCLIAAAAALGQNASLSQGALQATWRVTVRA